MVVICGYETVKNALVTHSEEFGGRPLIPVLYQVTKGNGECTDYFHFDFRYSFHFWRKEKYINLSMQVMVFNIFLNNKK